MRRGAAQWASGDIVELCAFRVGSEDYVVDIRRIREVVTPLEIHHVPRAPESIEGVVDLRGDVVPVVDVRRRLGIAPEPYTRKTKFLIAHVGSRLVALVVDGVSEVLRIPRSAIRPVPRLGGPYAPRLFLGVCGGRPEIDPDPHTEGVRGRDRDRFKLLLNVRALLEPLGPQQIAAAKELAGVGKEGGTPS